MALEPDGSVNVHSDMLRQFLDQMESPRRHLTFLVGLLVLTFVFTGLLAHEAHRAELSRQQTARGVLQDVAESAAQDWAVRLPEFMFGALASAMRGPVDLLMKDADAPLAAIQERSAAPSFCPNCRQPMGSPEFFEVPIADGSIRDGLSPGLRQKIVAHARSGTMPMMNRRLGGGLYLGRGDDGAPLALAAYAVFDDAGQPVRVIAFEVPMPVVREMVAYPFDLLEIVQPTLANGLPNDSFFVASARVAGVDVLGGGVPAEFSAAHVLEASGPLPDLELQVSVRPDAERLLVIGGSSTARLSLLLALLTAIAGLIVLALLLVRREAELVRLRADFISGVSHELRTPLAQIRMFTETLLLGRVRSDLERRRSLEIIDQEARRLTHLVENVLLFSKTEGGRHTRLAPETTSFAAEIRRAVESFAPMCRTRDVEIRTELQENITAQVDRGALRQILVNLIDNALKYGPASQRITVGIALFEDVARVWVDDEGPGIPVAERERIFESFHRLRRDVELRTAGSGIGLAVVRELARLHGGQASAEDAPGGGARLVVEFPGAYLRTEPASDLAVAS